MYQNYVTKDLYLSAYLRIKGLKFKVVKSGNSTDFEFEKTSDLLKYVNEYLTGDGSCDPLDYTNAIKNIKNIIHNHSL